MFGVACARCSLLGGTEGVWIRRCVFRLHVLIAITGGQARRMSRSDDILIHLYSGEAGQALSCPWCLEVTIPVTLPSALQRAGGDSSVDGVYSASRLQTSEVRMAAAS